MLLTPAFINCGCHILYLLQSQHTRNFQPDKLCVAAKQRSKAYAHVAYVSLHNGNGTDSHFGNICRLLVHYPLTSSKLASSALTLGQTTSIYQHLKQATAVGHMYQTS